LPELDVGEVEPLAFADAEADAVEELEDRTGALAARHVRIGMGEQAGGLRPVKDRRGQPPPRGEGEIERGLWRIRPPRSAAGTTACTGGGRSARVRRRRQVRGCETARDQLLEKPMRLPPVGDPGKRPVLPRQAHAGVLEHEHQEARLPRSETESAVTRSASGLIFSLAP
jgi:hypothetical protein